MLQARQWSRFKSFKRKSKGIKYYYYLLIMVSTLTNMYLIGVQTRKNKTKHVIKSKNTEFNQF